MSDLTLTKRHIRGGVWEGVLTGGSVTGETPEISVTHLEQPLTDVSITADTANPGDWNLRVAIPADILADGVQTIAITDAETGDLLDSISLITGEALDHDLRAEIDLMRAELDMLKRAFRRHCVETMGG